MSKRFYPQQIFVSRSKTRHIGRFPSWMKWVYWIIFLGSLTWALSAIDFTPVSQTIVKPERQSIASTAASAELKMEVEFEPVDQIVISTVADTSMIVPADTIIVVSAEPEVKRIMSDKKLKIRLPTVTLFNGCGVKGIGARAKAALERMGFEVVEVRNARNYDYKTSEVLDRRRNLDAGRLLSDSLGISRSLAAWDTTRSDSEADVSLIVGRDYKKLRWKI